MKVLLCTLAVFIAVCSVCEAGAGMKKFVEECKTETGITDEIKKGQKPNFEDPKVKCFVTCMQKKFGIIVDGKINADKLIEVYSKKKETDDAAKESLRNCAESANQVTDCEVGVALMKCMKEKGLSFFGKKKPQGEEGEQ